jgi:hypothetical protein
MSFVMIVFTSGWATRKILVRCVGTWTWTHVDERPIRDCAFEEELEVAIVGGRVSQVE